MAKKKPDYQLARDLIERSLVEYEQSQNGGTRTSSRILGRAIRTLQDSDSTLGGAINQFYRTLLRK